MSESGCDNSEHDIAEAVRMACIQAAIDGYENASISGLCAEGAFEAAISAIRMLDLERLAAGKKPEQRYVTAARHETRAAHESLCAGLPLTPS